MYMCIYKQRPCAQMLTYRHGLPMHGVLVPTATVASYTCLSPSCEVCHPPSESQVPGRGTSKAGAHERSKGGHEEKNVSREDMSEMLQTTERLPFGEELSASYSGCEPPTSASGDCRSQSSARASLASRPNTAKIESALEGAGEVRGRGRRHSSSVGGMVIAIRSAAYAHKSMRIRASAHAHAHTRAHKYVHNHT
jgi:hypothetical protein